MQILYAYNKDSLSSYEQKSGNKICPSAFVPSNERISNQILYYSSMAGVNAFIINSILKRQFGLRFFIGVPLIVFAFKGINYWRFKSQEFSRSFTLQKYGKKYLEFSEDNYQKVKMILDPRTSHYDLKRMEL